MQIYLNVAMISVALVAVLATFHLFRVSKGDILRKPMAVILLALVIFIIGVILDVLNPDILGSEGLMDDLLALTICAGLAISTTLFYLDWRRQTQSVPA
jgi:uncharacterized membrane protein